jgi:hypothetical protein
MTPTTSFVAGASIAIFATATGGPAGCLIR